MEGALAVSAFSVLKSNESFMDKLTNCSGIRGINNLEHYPLLLETELGVGNDNKPALS